MEGELMNTKFKTVAVLAILLGVVCANPSLGQTSSADADKELQAVTQDAHEFEVVLRKAELVHEQAQQADRQRQMASEWQPEHALHALPTDPLPTTAQPREALNRKDNQSSRAVTDSVIQKEQASRVAKALEMVSVY